MKKERRFNIKIMFLIIIIIILIMIILSSDLYISDINSDLYPGSKLTNLYWPQLGLAKNEYITYGNLDCIYIILTWTSKIIDEDNIGSEIVKYYSEKWKDYPWPMKGPGYLTYENYNDIFFINIYKGFGVNEDDNPMVKYGVDTEIFICKRPNK
jgi:hypothetical protein